MKLTPQELKLTLYYLHDEDKKLTVNELIEKLDQIPDAMYKFECETHIELSHVVSANLAAIF